MPRGGFDAGLPAGGLRLIHRLRVFRQGRAMAPRMKWPCRASGRIAGLLMNSEPPPHPPGAPERSDRGRRVRGHAPARFRVPRPGHRSGATPTTASSNPPRRIRRPRDPRERHPVNRRRRSAMESGGVVRAVGRARSGGVGLPGALECTIVTPHPSKASGRIATTGREGMGGSVVRPPAHHPRGPGSAL
jgi:hypothetical protein